MVSGTIFAATGLLSLLSATVNAQVAGACSGQSCYVASLAGSTTEPYVMKGGRKPTGGNAMGDNCIKAAYKKLGLSAPAGLRFLDQMRMNGNLEEFYGAAGLADGYGDDGATASDLLTSPEVTTSSRRQRRRPSEGGVLDSEAKDAEQAPLACSTNTLLFGRGTTEIGSLGSTVGPSLSSSFSSGGWSTHGIDYSADISGIYCLGMTGGLRCIEQINKLAAQCPQTNIVLSGYSQGAMVARICAAWANEKAKPLIKGLALFGDPFNGADVKGIPKERVRTWCNVGDGVCKGEFSIGAAHLSYVGSSTSAAVSWIKGIVGK